MGIIFYPCKSNTKKYPPIKSADDGKRSEIPGQARDDEWAGDDGMSRQSILPDLLRFCQQASDLVRV